MRKAPDLRACDGRWIAVLAGAVVASGATAGDVVDDLAKQGITDALVTQVPTDAERRAYLIA